jgi:DNA-binding GntR family transcriptional regulator
MIATATAFDWQFRLETLPNIFGDNQKTALDRHHEHTQIVQALTNRDAHTAETLMRQHILHATNAFLQARTHQNTT